MPIQKLRPGSTPHSNEVVNDLAKTGPTAGVQGGDSQVLPVSTKSLGQATSAPRRLTDLPTELTEIIASHLDIRSLHSFEQTSRSARNIVAGNTALRQPLKVAVGAARQLAGGDLTSREGAIRYVFAVHEEVVRAAVTVFSVPRINTLALKISAVLVDKRSDFDQRAALAGLGGMLMGSGVLEKPVAATLANAFRDTATRRGAEGIRERSRNTASALLEVDSRDPADYEPFERVIGQRAGSFLSRNRGPLSVHTLVSSEHERYLKIPASVRERIDPHATHDALAHPRQPA